MMLFILPAVYLLSSNGGRKKRPRHTSKLSGKEKLKEILEGHPKNCCVAFRMEPIVFREIADFLKREHLLRDTRGVRVDERLGFFLFMLSHNASYEDLQYEFKHSGSVKPTIGSGPHWKISTDPRFFPYFENCLGAIDGTHIPITIDEEKQAPYRNRKGTLSQNMMLACGLVELLHYHNNDCYKSQNGWSQRHGIEL